MVDITIISNNEALRELTRSVISFCIAELLPGIRKLRLHVEFRNPDMGSDVMAYCERLEDRFYAICVSPGQTYMDFIRYLCHEMVHVKQYVRREIRQVGDKYYWQGHRIDDVEYHLDPCEIEAFDLDDKLTTKFLTTCRAN